MGLSVLDRYIPKPDICERHHTTVRAPAEVAYRVAMEFDFESLFLVRAILRGREILMRAPPALPAPPMGFVAKTRSMGWGLLTEEPGRLYVCGAKCQPWLPEVVFTPIEPEKFSQYAEPGLVKIAWTIEASPIGPDHALLGTETRAVATDEGARRKFLPYFRRMRPGILAIRWLVLPAMRRRAEAVWRARG
ncbi:MAG TPA: hypothetical protein VGR66_07975 [Candidatus Eisenbacteria bacterium]|jgi:hypothetical protein|nr:hypothetical protein [Candidatus Eisenbacteria bacterium]